MKVVKKENIGIHHVYNTNVKDNFNYLSESNIVNHNCVVDSNYRGIVHAHLFNNSDENVVILRSDKLTQFVVVPVWTGQPQQVTELDMDTDRGEGGFGSTGA